MVPLERGHTNCANTWFQRFTKRQTPLRRTVSGEDLRRGVCRDLKAPVHLRQVGCPDWLTRLMFMSKVIFYAGEKNTTVPREKQATVKLVISTVTITRRKQHYIHFCDWERLIFLLSCGTRVYWFQMQNVHPVLLHLRLAPLPHSCRSTRWFFKKPPNQ